ncbi:MAG: phage/plasmid primase, P4 family [Woeseia sp.]
MSVIQFKDTYGAWDATEDALASKLVSYHPNIRYCQTWGKWLIWDEQVWKHDETIAVFDLIRRFCRSQSELVTKNDGDLRKICSAVTVAAIERLCKSDRAYAAVPDQFDRDDWSLNTPGGLVNLKDGTICEQSPDAYCMKITAVEPEGECPRWTEFLGEVTNHDAELIAFLQRMAGYCLTGSTMEHALFFLYGSGGNGKSVFIDTLSGVMKDYAQNSPMETFTESHTDRHPTELAKLQGSRLVFAQETEQGRKWAQAKIKALTGGDKISARFMRQDYFEYKPKFKLVIAGNTKPKLDHVDEAMRRRFHVVPFTVQIPAENRDRELSEKLRREYSGILAWAVEGCLQYQAQGLNPPSAVTEATANYLEAQDVFGEWLATECETGPEHWEPSSLLFNSWKNYAEAARERVGRQAEFRERMENAGFHKARDYARGHYWQGIRAIPKEAKW